MEKEINNTENENIKVDKKDRAINTKHIIVLIVLVLLNYFTISLLVTLANLVGMVIQNKNTRGVELGEQAYEQAIQNGAKEYYALYTDEEIKQNPYLEMVKLYYFPAKKVSEYKENKKSDYVVILPGGGYFECDTAKVAFPCASEVVRSGYSAFVLVYRYGKACSKFAPTEDMARAVGYIVDHAEEFKVNAENYSVIGYSAGGNLAALYGTKELGYAKYGLPKPQSLSLAYPVIDTMTGEKITGNAWGDLVKFFSRVVINDIMLDTLSPKKEDKEKICVNKQVDSDYPPTYIITGNNDMVIDYKNNSVAFSETLKANGVANSLTIVKKLNHGFGLGIGTDAENWVIDALAYWRTFADKN